MTQPTPDKTISLTVNGQSFTRDVEARCTLADFLRHSLDLTGTHVGCEHGVCGACTVLVDGEAARSCIMFAIQADGHAVQTVESLAKGDVLNPLQAAFITYGALQCGFCTPGFLMAATDLLNRNPTPTRFEVQDALSGNVCRCTGYQPIVEAVLAVAASKLCDD
ncbi:MAG: (2Fe-2S)-binding protein [Pseudomonadota bacterium]